MRQIKFRGKRVDNGEWVYGYYVQDPLGNHRIYYKPFEGCTSNTYHFVDPATIGQFTGLLDKNGKEIYEGDLIEYGNNRFMPVEFINGTFCICRNTSMPTLMTLFHIIGNLHDSPSLTNH